MPRNPPLVVTVLVAAYNAGRFIEPTVDSVLRQTFANFELIVVDDGSTDDTVQRLEQYGDQRLRIIRQQNQGAPAALNTGLRAAYGKYVGFLDHDDLWRNTKLERHVGFLEQHSEVDLTFSWSRLIDEAGHEMGWHTRRWRGPLSFQEMLTDFVIGNTSSVVMRRTVFEAAGWFDPQLPRYYDVDLFLRVALLRPNNTHAIEEELTLYRRHPLQMSRDWGGMQRDWERLLEKFRGLAPQQTTAVERNASSNMYRYFTYLAYESREFRQALRFLRNGFRRAPRGFLLDPRNWTAAAGCLAGLVLPSSVHRGLERLAGIRQEPTS